MTYRQLIKEVGEQMGVPDDLMRRAMQWAVITNPGTLRESRKRVPKRDEHITRMYFKLVLYRLVTDPEYREQLERDIKEQTERN